MQNSASDAHLTTEELRQPSVSRPSGPVKETPHPAGHLCGARRLPWSARSTSPCRVPSSVTMRSGCGILRPRPSCASDPDGSFHQLDKFTGTAVVGQFYPGPPAVWAIVTDPGTDPAACVISELAPTMVARLVALDREDGHQLLSVTGSRETTPASTPSNGVSRAYEARHVDLLVSGDGNPHISREVLITSNRHQPKCPASSVCAQTHRRAPRRGITAV